MTKVKVKNIAFKYTVPISESFRDEKDFMIAGIAINETTTSNGHKFVAEELRKSAGTLINVPLLKDHDNSVDSIVGRVKDASFDESGRNIPFKAQVNDKKIQELINRGDLNTVSIGASVDPKDIDELDDGTIIPRNITFKELSLVAVPADPNATFDVALKEAYSSTSVDNIELKGGINMTEEETTEQVEEPTEEPEEPKEEVEEPTKEAANLLLVNKLLKENATLRKQYADELAKAEEADVDEVKPAPVEEPKEEAEEDEEDEEEVTESQFLEGRGSLKGSSMTLVRAKY